MDSNKTITLLTDFGDKLGYVAQMKGVIHSINPQANIIDISHSIDPADIVEASYVLSTSVNFFPENSINVSIVDPGVGSERFPIIIESKIGTFIGPDNGLFGFLEKLEVIHSIHILENEKYQLENVASTFHGRDIFASAAAHYSLGTKADDFGRKIEKINIISSFEVIESEEELAGCILTFDSFGNIISSISSVMLEKFKQKKTGKKAAVFFKGEILDIHKTFSNVAKGGLLAYIGSGRHLEIAINQGDAKAQTLAVKGDEVRIILK